MSCHFTKKNPKNVRFLISDVVSLHTAHCSAHPRPAKINWDLFVNYLRTYIVLVTFKTSNEIELMIYRIMNLHLRS